MRHQWRPAGEHTNVPLGEARSNRLGAVSLDICMTVGRAGMWM